MPTLTAAQRQDVRELVTARLSATFTEIPANKDAVLAVIGAFDDGLDAAETDILTNRVSPGARTWLQNNPGVARRIFSLVAEIRSEVL